MVELIKYFFIELNNLYIFFKLLGIKVTNRIILSGAVYSLIIAGIIKYVRVYAPMLTIIILIISTMVYIIFSYRMSLQTLIITSIISVAGSYGVYFVLTFCFVTLFHFIFTSLFNFEISNEIINVVVGLFEIILSYKLSHTKRFKNGIASLKQRGTNTVGILISLLILFIATLLIPSIEANWIWLIPIFVLLTLSFLLYLWWVTRIKKSYLEKIRSREIEILQKELEAKENEINNLHEHNDALASIIHKDNKLIPAMESAVRDCLTMILSDDNINDTITKATMLLEQLDKMTQDRTGILTEYERTNTHISNTNILSIDILFSYLYKKAEQKQITLTYILSGDIKKLIDNHINETELQTLFADLIENAIIATQESVIRNITVNINIESSIPEIAFYDTGISFTINTLSQIGLTRVTTHKAQNGSGIGLMTTFDILQKCKASFELEEYAINETYTKRISLCFDGLNEYRIKSPRMEEIDNTIKRIDLTLIS